MKRSVTMAVLVMLLISTRVYAIGSPEAESSEAYPGVEGVPGSFPIVKNKIVLKVFAVQYVRIENRE